MKVFLRVLIVVLILAGLGLGTYFIFFKPSDNDAVFVSLTEMMEYRSFKGNTVEKSNATDDKLLEIKRQISSGAFSIDYTASIEQSRLFLLSDEPFKINGGDDLYLSCFLMDTQLSEMFDYYFAYTQTAQKVQKSVVKKIDTAIKNYKSAYDELNLKLNSIINLQNVISENQTNGVTTDYVVELTSRYDIAVLTYRKTIKEYVNLIQEVKAFVEKYVFDGKLINDRDIATFDISLYTIKKAVDVDFGKNVEGDKERAEALRLLNCAFIFIYDHLSLNDEDPIKQVKNGCVIINQGYGSTVYSVETVGENNDILIMRTSFNTVYRYAKNTDAIWGWYRCDSENYVLSSLDEKLENAQYLSEDMFLKNVGVYDENAENYVLNLKHSKMVANYTYIVENGYLDEFLNVLASDKKAEFMKDSTVISGIAEQSVSAIKYVLACYGFCA